MPRFFWALLLVLLVAAVGGGIGSAFGFVFGGLPLLGAAGVLGGGYTGWRLVCLVIEGNGTIWEYPQYDGGEE